MTTRAQRKRRDPEGAVDGVADNGKGRSMGSVDAARYVLEHGYIKVRGGVLLDRTTASAIVTVADALNEENRERLNRMEITRAASIAWKLVK